MQSPTQPPDLLADLVRDGGATYDLVCLNLTGQAHFEMPPFTPSDGYAVGIGGITLPRDGLGNDMLLWACIAVAKEFGSRYVGTWLDGDTVYIDAVRWFWHAPDAIRCAMAHDQKAVFDFAAQSELRVQQMEFDQ